VTISSVGSGVLDYLASIHEGLPGRYDPALASVLLAGSVGWGIKDSQAPGTDWDIHIILPTDDYAAFVASAGATFLIDDKKHSPPIFGCFHSVDWLEDRLHSSSDRNRWPLYLWIVENGQWVHCTEEVRSAIARARAIFDRDNLNLIRDHFVAFCVRKLEVKTSAANKQFVSENLYLGECLTAGLQTFSLAQGRPYPYLKWLPYWIANHCGGTELAAAAQECWTPSFDVRERIAVLRKMETMIVAAIRERYGNQPWLSEWWKYLDN
jgi:hypothetical protein